jgi:hypothetical protein
MGTHLFIVSAIFRIHSGTSSAEIDEMAPKRVTAATVMRRPAAAVKRRPAAGGQPGKGKAKNKADNGKGKGNGIAVPPRAGNGLPLVPPIPYTIFAKFANGCSLKLLVTEFDHQTSLRRQLAESHLFPIDDLDILFGGHRRNVQFPHWCPPWKTYRVTTKQFQKCRNLYLFTRIRRCVAYISKSSYSYRFIGYIYNCG